MSTPDEFLPTVRPSEVSLVDLPSELVELTLLAAEPALERQALINGNLILDKGTLFISHSPYDKTVEATLRHIGEEHGRISISFKAARQPSYVGYVKPSTIVADSRLDLEAKLEKRRKLDDQRIQLSREHSLGEGGLILANAFGGMDPEQPELTSRHLVLRAIIARKAELFDVQDVVQAGLLNTVLSELVGRDFATYMKTVHTFLDSLTLLPSEMRQTAGPSIIEGAVIKGREFVEAQSGVIIMAAHVGQNPALAQKVIKAAEKQ